jgi:hypothetical protein
VALGAVEARVLPGERELGAGVVEPARRLPALLAVALLAVGAELPPVLVEVAGVARGRLAEEGLAPRRLLERRGHQLVGDAPRVVAPGAVEVAVLALELEPGARVIEALLAALAPVDQGLVAPLVLVVAALTLPLRRREPTVEPEPPLDPGLQLGVALQASLRGELLAGDVALGAGLEPSLQRLMRPAQLAGREDVRGARRQRAEHRRGRQRGQDQVAGSRRQSSHQNHPYPR